MNPKYLFGIKPVSGDFNYRTGGDGEFFIDHATVNQKRDDVQMALATVVADTMQISQAILSMLNGYMLEESVSLTPIINQVMQGVTNTGNAISASVTQISEQINQLSAAAVATNEELTEAQAAAANQIGSIPGIDGASAANQIGSIPGIDGASAGGSTIDPTTGLPVMDPSLLNPTTAATTGAVIPTGVDSASTAAMLGLTPEQLDVVKATIRHEAGNNPAEIANVASAVKNRMNSGAWGGTDPYSVVTASGQFESYFGGHYKQYTGGNYYQGDAGTAAAVDQTINAILTGQMAPTHGYSSFRGKGSSNGVQLTEGGNKYR